MNLTAREFLKGMGLAAAAGTIPVSFAAAAAGVTVDEPGFRGFAMALAAARCGAAAVLNVREGRLLAAWADADRFRIVSTGGVEEGVWRLKTRGLCMEFMLRMEIMGPIASTPHPRPNSVWEPVLEVASARRLMMRMLAESGVRTCFDVPQAKRFVASRREVTGDEFVSGQLAGTAAALGAPADSPRVQARFVRDLALPG